MTGLVAQSGRVAGVRVGDQVIAASAVVLATGGYGNAPDLLRRFYPSAAELGQALHYVGADSNQGDGIRMGMDVGAQFSGQDRGLLLLAPLFATVNEPALPPSLILVNAHGHRFMAEDLPYSVSPGIVAAQPDGAAWALFDEPYVAASLAATPEGKIVRGPERGSPRRCRPRRTRRRPSRLWRKALVCVLTPWCTRFGGTTTSPLDTRTPIGRSAEITWPPSQPHPSTPCE